MVKRLQWMARGELFLDDAGKWRWRIIANNGRKVASSGESFASRRNALRAFWTMVYAVQSTGTSLVLNAPKVKR